MALTKFNESVTNHQSLPDKPSLTSAQLKTLFDKASVDIKTYINSTLTAEIDSKISELTTKINSVYPVGSIYMSVNSTNPSTLFGGTWVAWGSGRVPVGINSNEAEFNTVEKTGGAKTHTLTTGQLPSHNHSLNNHTHSFSGATSSNGRFSAKINALANAMGANLVSNVTGIAGRDYSAIGYYNNENRQRYESDFFDILDVSNHNHTFSGTTGQSSGNTGNAGSGQAHNNLQPYITCYMWKRTA